MISPASPNHAGDEGPATATAVVNGGAASMPAEGPSPVDSFQAGRRRMLAEMINGYSSSRRGFLATIEDRTKSPKLSDEHWAYVDGRASVNRDLLAFLHGLWVAETPAEPVDEYGCVQLELLGGGL